MVPEDRRQQLAGRHGDEVRGGARAAHRRKDQEANGRDRAEQLDRGRDATRQPELVGDRARREVMRRGDRVADVAQEREVVRPDREAAGYERRNDRRPDEHGDADDHRLPAPRNERPSEDEPGLDLDDRPCRRRPAERRRSVEPSPADRKEQEEQRPHLSQLEGVGERPRQPCEEDRQPADRRRDGHHRNAHEERRERQPDPGPRRDRRIERGERQDREDERRRVVEEAEAARLLDRRVVQALAGQDPVRRLVVGEEIEAERARARGRPQGRAEDDTEDEERDDREGRSGQARRCRRGSRIRLASRRPNPRRRPPCPMAPRRPVRSRDGSEESGRDPTQPEARGRGWRASGSPAGPPSGWV